MILPQIRLLRANGLDDDSSIIGLELEPRLSHKEPAGPRPFTWGAGEAYLGVRASSQTLGRMVRGW